MKKLTGQLEEWEWIERYWLGQLSADERTYFEQLMKDDNRLAEEANSLRFGVELVEEARLEANARQTLRQLRQESRLQRTRRTRWGALVGGLVAPCLAFVIYLAYAPIALPVQESDPSVLREFRQQYRTDSTNYLTLRQKQAFDRFFEGQAYLSEGQPQLAARRFEDVLAFAEMRPYFREAAQWHLLICYVRTNQLAKANGLYEQLGQAREYDIDRVERWKIWWHLRRLSWLATR